MIRWLMTVAAALAALAAPGIAAAADAVESRAAVLAPGEFVWTPERADAGPIEIVIGLAEQRAWVFRDGELIGISTVSSGKEGHESPVGRFQILQKRRDHRSNRYGDAPMPFMQRLNWYGVALHGGHVPDHPASHGCIRLPLGFARALYGATELGSFVYVSGEPIGSAGRALALARANADAPMPPDRTFEWVRAGR
jgi:hypothetical protein